MRTLTSLLVASLTLAIVSVTRAEPELKGSPSELAAYLKSVPGQITLTASAETKAEANRAVLQLRVTAKDKLLQKALEKNHKTREDIVQTLTAQGLDKNGIRISKFSSTPTYGWFSKEKAGSYEISSLVTIKAANESDVQAAAQLVDANPDITMVSIQFEHTDKDKFNQKAVEDALAKINAQKKIYEDQLGVTLRARGALANTDIRSTVMGNTKHKSAYVLAATTIAPEEAPTSDISQFDEVLYQATVTIVFDVLPKDGGK